MILSKRFPFFLLFETSRRKSFRMLIDFLRKLFDIFNIETSLFYWDNVRKRDYEFQMKVSTPSKCKNRGQSTVTSTHLQLKFITRTLSSSIGENSFSSFSWCLFPPARTMSATFALRFPSFTHFFSFLFSRLQCWLKQLIQ